MNDFTKEELSFMYRAMEYMIDHGIWLTAEPRRIKYKLLDKMENFKVGSAFDKVSSKYADALKNLKDR